MVDKGQFPVDFCKGVGATLPSPGADTKGGCFRNTRPFYAGKPTLAA